MSPTTDFLHDVLPEAGRYCVVGISGGKVLQEFVDDIDTVAERAESFADRKIDAYFAVASFKEGSEKRTQENAQWMKSFWLDLDCGPGKPYPDQATALEALEDFRVKAKLPHPSIVNSGNGVHVYWLLTQYIPSSAWSPIAERLKAACAQLGLNADPAVTADEARILRVPQTLNFKNPNDPKWVTQYEKGEPVDVDLFADCLAALDLPEPKRERVKVDTSQLSETAKALLGNKQSRFGLIVAKTKKGKGCNFLKYAIENQAELEEPLWRASLSIAWACDDRDTAIHRISERHPGYTPEDTIEKACQTKGPYTCAVIKGLSADLCQGCTHKITSPIQLGAEVKRDASELFEVPDEDDPHGDGTIATQVVAQALFKPPFPYFRGANGGVYREDRDEDGDKIEQLIYEHDLYASTRLVDPNDGECVVFHHVLPRDGEREFMVPIKDMHSADQFKKILGGKGVAGSKKQMNEIMDYAIRYTKELQMREKAKEARLQFGWHAGNTEFVVGNRVYTKDGVSHNYPSSTTANIIDSFNVKGSLETWKKIFNVLNQPGMEALQLVALSGFGAPMMKFTGVAGGVINLISNHSGTGKSTAGRLALSVFGHPEKTLLTQRDTMASRQHRLGVHNNLVALSDEMTNAPAEFLSDEIYGTSQGRGRNRMNATSNTERVNESTWNLIHLMNSNASMISKLVKLKARPDGELMRLIEIPVKRQTIEGADALFAMLEENYGVAGEVYAPWLVKNAEKIPELLDRQRERIWKKVDKRIEERFHIGTYAANLASGHVAKALGLIEFDLENLENWCCELIKTSRSSMQAEVIDAYELVGEFIYENLRQTAVIGTEQNVVSTFANDYATITPNGGSCTVRYEEDGNMLYIAYKNLRDYCTQRQFTIDDVLNGCSVAGGPYTFRKKTKKRMLAKTRYTMSPPVDAVEFHVAPEEAEAFIASVEELPEYEDAEMES
jgi:hypothetical protein